MPSIKISDEKHWHELRAKRIGASEMGALFHAHEHMGYWQLFRTKRGDWKMEVTDAMVAGNFLEEGVAKYVSHKLGVDLVKCSEYFFLDDAPIGCTPDYYNPVKKEFVQIKVARRTWEDLPLYVELQALTEMMCTGTTTHTTYVLNPFFEIVPFERTATPERYAEMMRRSEEMMLRVANNDEPDMDDNSAHMAGDYYRGRDVPDQSLELIGDEVFATTMTDYQTHGDAEKLHKDKREILRARILHTLDTNQYAVFDGGTVSAKTDARGARRINVKWGK